MIPTDPMPTGAAWELVATMARGDVIRAARVWRSYRRFNPGQTSDEYAALCAALDDAIDTYGRIIAAY